jgi:1,4-alpha-glucan branching enzyme
LFARHLSGKTFDLEQLKQVLDPQRQGYPAGTTKLINFLSNHDQNPLMAELGEHNIFDEDAFQRIKCGTVLLMTAVGVPMLWMGQELGEYKPKATNEPNKIDWTVLKNKLNHDLWEYHRRLIALRKQNTALQSHLIEFFHENPQHKVFAYLRWDNETAKVAIIVNLSEQTLTDYEISDFPQGRWCDYFENGIVETEGTQFKTNLASFQARIFISLS